MQIFLSWSGAHSHAVAQVFNDWLPTVIQSVRPWISSEHVSKGATWLQDIWKALSDSNGVGLFFLTRDALQSEWLMFEAGGIAALDKKRVCTVCVDLTPADLKPPLNFFQATRLEREDLFKLARDLNRLGGVPLADDVLKKAFDRAWPDLEAALRQASAAVDPTTSKATPKPAPANAAHIAALMEGMRRIEARLANLEELQHPGLRGDFVPASYDEMQAANLIRGGHGVSGAASEFSAKLPHLGVSPSMGLPSSLNLPGLATGTTDPDRKDAASVAGSFTPSPSVTRKRRVRRK